MATYASNAEGIAELKKLAARLPEILQEIDAIRQELSNTYLDNSAGLGEHTADIQNILNDMITLTNSAKQSLTGVADDVMALALTYEDLLNRGISVDV